MSKRTGLTLTNLVFIDALSLRRFRIRRITRYHRTPLSFSSTRLVRRGNTVHLPLCHYDLLRHVIVTPVLPSPCTTLALDTDSSSTLRFLLLLFFCCSSPLLPFGWPSLFYSHVPFRLEPLDPSLGPLVVSLQVLSGDDSRVSTTSEIRLRTKTKSVTRSRKTLIRKTTDVEDRTHKNFT